MLRLGHCEHGHRQLRGCNTPHVGIVALLPKTGADGSTLLLHHGALVGDGLGGTHIPDELLHCIYLSDMSRV